MVDTFYLLTFSLGFMFAVLQTAFNRMIDKYIYNI